jgi:hypothetical protein
MLMIVSFSVPLVASEAGRFDRRDEDGVRKASAWPLAADGGA